MSRYYNGPISKIYNYMGYNIFRISEKNWAVGNYQSNGKMFIHAEGYSTLYMAMKGASAHFGRL